MSYIKLIGDTIQVFGEVKPDEDAIYVQSIPHIDIPKYQKLVYENDTVKVVTDIDGIKQAIYDKLLKQYKEAIKSTDDEFLAYKKREEYNILTEKDETDYNNAKQLYTEQTLWYRTERERIADMDDEELIEYYNLIKRGLA